MNSPEKATNKAGKSLTQGESSLKIDTEESKSNCKAGEMTLRTNRIQDRNIFNILEEAEEMDRLEQQQEDFEGAKDDSWWNDWVRMIQALSRLNHWRLFWDQGVIHRHRHSHL